MIPFHSLEVENWNLFAKRVTVPLNKYPLLVIRGQNLNSGDPRQSNAAGKSQLMSVIPTVVYAAPPITSKHRDLAGMVDGSRLSLSFANNSGVSYAIEQTFKRSVRYRVLKSGKDLKVRTTPLAQKMVKELLPWSDAVFYSTIYLDGRRPFTFQMGKDSERLAFFTKLFALDEYDGIHKRLLQRRQSLKDEAVRASTLEAEIVRQKSAKAKAKWDSKTEERWLALDASRTELHDKLEEANRKVQELLPLVTLWERQSKLDDESKLDMQADVADIKSAVALHRAWDAYETASAEYTRKRKSILKKLAKLEEHQDSKTIESSLSKLERMLGALEANVESTKELRETLDMQLSKLRDDYQAVDARLEDLPEAPKGATKESLNAERHNHSNLKKLAKLVTSGHQQCPTCGSSLDADKIRSLVAKSAKRLNAIELGLERLEMLGRLASIEKSGKELRQRLSETDQTKLAQLELRLKKLRKQHQVLEESLETARDAESLSKQLDSLKKPKQPKDSRPTKSMATLRKEYAVYEQSQMLRKLRASLELEVLELTGSKRITKQPKLRPLVKTQRETETALRAINGEHSSLQVRREAHRIAVRNLKSLNADYQKLQAVLEDMPVLDALIAAYGNKGLKVSRAASLAKYIEDTLNSKSRLIFVEPTTFHTHVSEGKFSVTYKRGKREADIQRLSGAESKAFALLLLSAYLPLVPSHLRTNLLVLDEMDANMSPATKQIFIHDFLPYLQTVVPNIVVVTPDTDTHYPDAKVITVVKKGQHSTVRGL